MKKTILLSFLLAGVAGQAWADDADISACQKAIGIYAEEVRSLSNSAEPLPLPEFCQQETRGAAHWNCVSARMLNYKEPLTKAGAVCDKKEA